LRSKGYVKIDKTKFLFNISSKKFQVGFAWEILRVPAFIIYLISYFMAKTDKEKRHAANAPEFEYYLRYGRELLIFTIGVTYASMARNHY
jgi:hypothetical protein